MPNPNSSNRTLSISGARRTKSFPHQQTINSSVQQKFPAYNNFKWEKLKAFLDDKFKGWTQYDQQRIDDHWVFNVPEELTEIDRWALVALRDSDVEQWTTRPSVSPE